MHSTRLTSSTRGAWSRAADPADTTGAVGTLQEIDRRKVRPASLHPLVSLAGSGRGRGSIVEFRTLRAGVFLPPFHPNDEDPLLCMERDFELMQWLDKLGYAEAWIGEHHSGGYEIY